MFSLAGAVVSKKRASLTPENASMLVRLNLLQKYDAEAFDRVVCRAKQMYNEAQKRGKHLGGTIGKK